MKRTKASKFDDIAVNTLKLIDLYGANGLKLSQIAKAAKLSRAWIYKYVGKDKAKVIEFSVAHIARSFSELDHPSDLSSIAAWTRSQVEGFKNGFEASLKSPWIIHLYYKNRGLPNSIGNLIKEVEMLYLEALSNELRTLFRYSKEHSQKVAELYFVMKMAMNHHWISSPHPTEGRKKELLAFLSSHLISIVSK